MRQALQPSASRITLTLFLPSEQLNVAWNSRCQGPATAQLPVLAKEGLSPHAGCLSCVLSYRVPRGKGDTRLLVTEVFAFIKNAENQIKAICFRSNETILFYVGFCMFVRVLALKTLLPYANNSAEESERFGDQTPKPIKVLYFIWPAK